MCPPDRLFPRTPTSGNTHGASHLHPGLSCSSGAGDHDGFGSTTGALGAHRRVIGRHPFEGAAAVGGLYRHETHPVFELASHLVHSRLIRIRFLLDGLAMLRLSPSCATLGTPSASTRPRKTSRSGWVFLDLHAHLAPFVAVFPPPGICIGSFVCRLKDMASVPWYHREWRQPTPA